MRLHLSDHSHKPNLRGVCTIPSMQEFPGRADRFHYSGRAGIASFWVLLSLPLFLSLFIVIIEIGVLWNARSELVTALESAALAGVKTWGDTVEEGLLPGDLAATTVARRAALAAFTSNTVSGKHYALNANESPTGIYGNLSCNGDVVLYGALPGSNSADTSLTPSCGAGSDVSYCVAARKTLVIPSISQHLFGISIGPFEISGQATARADCTGSGIIVGNPKLAHVTSFTCTD